jgi:hypothetical protein
MWITFIYAPVGYIPVSKDRPAGGNVVSRLVILEIVLAPIDNVKFGVGFLVTNHFFALKCHNGKGQWG